MRPTNPTFDCRFLYAAVAAVGLATGTARGQSVESRYGSPPSGGVAPANTPTPDEPLISYRRDEPGEAPAVEVREPRIASSATLGDSNTLRTPAEPAPLPAATLGTPPVETTLPELSQVPPIEAPPDTSAAPLPASNPFPPAAEAPVTSTPTTEAPIAAAPPLAIPFTRYDAAVEPAVHEAVTPPADDFSPGLLADATDATPHSRRLVPPPSDMTSQNTTDSAVKEKTALPFAFSKLESFTTAGAGLAIVVGLFLICVWMLRRGGGKVGGVLPSDAFAVLGRAPLTPQSFAHLLRLGNKLVLVAMSPDGIQPLTEVTDPMEVDRLTGLCASGRGYGPSAEFKQVLAQLSKEPARGFLGAEASEGGRRR